MSPDASNFKGLVITDTEGSTTGAVWAASTGVTLALQIELLRGTIYQMGAVTSIFLFPKPET